MTRVEFMRRLLVALPVPFYSPSSVTRQEIRTHIHIDGREVARAVHRAAKEAK